MEKENRPVEQKERWLAATLGSIGEALIATDPEGVITFVNARAEALTGWNAKDAVGTALSQVVQIADAENRDLLASVVRKVLIDNVDVQLLDQTLITRHGQIPVDDSIAPIRSGDDEVLGAVIVFRDIRERKRADQVLLRHVDELETRNDELEAFAHTLAHDLKDQLALIIGFADLLESDSSEMSLDDLKTCMSAIVNNGNKMNAIIEGLLLLAQVHKMKVKPEPLPMERVVAEARYRLRNLVEEYEAEVVLPEAWPKVLGFAPWVEEVWVNYLSNALKYGGRPPRVELGADVESDGWVRFWVRDNGPGIAAEEQSKLFVPFTQLHTVDVESHGLGLSIVQGIVEKLGGRVSVQSEEGAGSTFSFTLPLAPVQPRQQRASRTLDEAGPIKEACTRAA